MIKCPCHYTTELSIIGMCKCINKTISKNEQYINLSRIKHEIASVVYIWFSIIKPCQLSKGQLCTGESCLTTLAPYNSMTQDKRRHSKQNEQFLAMTFDYVWFINNLTLHTVWWLWVYISNPNRLLCSINHKYRLLKLGSTQACWSH